MKDQLFNKMWNRQNFYLFIYLFQKKEKEKIYSRKDFKNKNSPTTNIRTVTYFSEEFLRWFLSRTSRARLRTWIWDPSCFNFPIVSVKKLFEMEFWSTVPAFLEDPVWTFLVLAFILWLFSLLEKIRYISFQSK